MCSMTIHSSFIHHALHYLSIPTHVLTILQRCDSFCLLAEDTVPYIIGGQHSKFV